MFLFLYFKDLLTPCHAGFAFLGTSATCGDEGAACWVFTGCDAVVAVTAGAAEAACFFQPFKVVTVPADNTGRLCPELIDARFCEFNGAFEIVGICTIPSSSFLELSIFYNIIE